MILLGTQSLVKLLEKEEFDEDCFFVHSSWAHNKGIGCCKEILGNADCVINWCYKIAFWNFIRIIFTNIWHNNENKRCFYFSKFILDKTEKKSERKNQSCSEGLLMMDLV